MDANLHNGFTVKISNHAKESKKDAAFYDLYLMFTISQNGYTYSRTPFSIGMTVLKPEWGGTRIGMKPDTKQGRKMNDTLSTLQARARAALERLSEVDTRTAKSIHQAIHANVKTAITGKAPRGQKKQRQDELNKLTFEYAAQIYQTELRKGEKPLGQSRKNNLGTVLKKLHLFFNDNKPKITDNTPLLPNITKKEIIAWKEWYYKKYPKHTAETRATYIGIITALFYTAVNHDLIPFSPVPKGFTPSVQKKDRKERTILEQEEKDRLANIGEDRLTKLERTAKHCAVLQLETGMQYADIRSLTRQHYRYNNHTREWSVKKAREKSGQVFRVILSNDAKQSLDRLTEFADGDLSNLPKLRVINKQYKRLADRTGINRFTTYDLRHTFAVHYMDKGGSTEVLAEMMGHNRYETTKRYGKISDERMGRDKLSIEQKQLSNQP